MHSLCAALIGVALAGQLEVDVRPLAGPVVSGNLTSISAGAGLSQEAVVHVDGQPQTFPVTQLAAITLRTPAERPKDKPTTWIALADGSELLATAYTTGEGKANVALLGGGEGSLKPEGVQNVRFREQSPAIAEQWQKIVDKVAASDIVVVRKGESLDYLEGVLGDVTADKVAFELDGEKLNVDRAKIEGILYFRPAARPGESVCAVRDTLGSTFQAATVEFQGAEAKITTGAGLSVTRPAAQIQQFDFSQGKILYLSDLAPASVVWTPLFGLPNPSPEFDEFFKPRLDRAYGGAKLSLRFREGRKAPDDRKFDKGLAIHSRTEIVYRLPSRFRSLKGFAGIDASQEGRGHVILTILGDDAKLLERAVSGADEPFELDLDLTGVRKLTILVDYGEDLDISDHLDLVEARIIK